MNISDVNISDVNISYHDCTGMEHSDSDPIRERLASTREGECVQENLNLYPHFP